MINILRYREILAELRARINKRSEMQIEGVILAVSDKHLTKKLKDQAGFFLCANFPDAESKGNADNYKEDNRLLLFLLEKVPAGDETDEDEITHYARIQDVMCILKDEIRNMKFVCGEISGGEEINTEWEYDVFGGFNGLSIGLKLTDYD